ncbi:YozQ family protein [Ferdinandcohnia quinoae]|uniref:YozQ family protein n=1 Tax=Fredinandcohnia quinoae TaxID=2918902 RepID=A0AAW5E3M6_9BACI|nr:YozQ family protein [Fredinandcohnia sp. SECRCQ15]MCH1627083.1 YozQ family protein [Fredinandcohnia sp. SECRCQ15]
MKENNNKQANNLAGRHYKAEDYQKNDQVSSGLATTHEQVSDAYMEGEIKAGIDNNERAE